jgi:hypothetical protein
VQATFDDVAEDAVSLTNVWVQTQGDGLVRADQIVGIEAHQTLRWPASQPAGCSTWC